MPTTPEAIIAAIADASAIGFRGQLIARGQARAMIWRDGILPPGAPGFSPQLSYDLHAYGYGLLGLGLRLLEMGGDPGPAPYSLRAGCDRPGSGHGEGQPPRERSPFSFHHGCGELPPRSSISSCIFSAFHGWGGGKFLADGAGTCDADAARDNRSEESHSYVSSERYRFGCECPYLVPEEQIVQKQKLRTEMGTIFCLMV